MSLWKCVVVAVMSFGLIACDSAENKAAARAGVERFRQQMAHQQFSEIEREWSDTVALKRNLQPGQIADVMRDISMQLGAKQSSREVECRIKNATVTLEYETVFEKKGKAEERFIFQIKDGAARLERYHLGGVSIQSASAG